MKHCQICNSSADDDAKFCMNCGSRFLNISDFNPSNPRNGSNNYYNDHTSENQLIINPVSNQPYYSPIYSNIKEPNQFNNNPITPSPDKISSDPFGIKIIALYEVVLSILFINFGLSQVTINSTSVLVGQTTFYSSHPFPYQLFGTVFIIWGIIGILAGIFLIIKNRIGYHLSRVFMASTGILFFWLFFPLLIMFVTFIYFNKNDSFIFIFKNHHINN